MVAWIAGLPLGVDSAVYRSGALAVLGGEPLYDHLRATPPWSPDLPFTYPPIAAVLFLPLALLPTQLTWAVFAAGSALGVGGVLRWVGRRPTFLVLALVFSLEPVWRTVGFGQVNVLLMAMVVFDLVRGRTGVLVGIAAAVKLTPLIFVLHFLVTGRYKEAGRALATFAGLHLLGFLLLPADSTRFWGSALIRGNNATGNGWITNQSISGVVTRLGGSTAASLVLAVGCLALGLVLARQAHRRGEPVQALLITAFCGLLVSPISWSHHWVWVVLLARQPLVWVVFAGWWLVVPSDVVLLDNLYVLAGGVLMIGWQLARPRVDIRSADVTQGRWGA